MALPFDFRPRPHLGNCSGLTRACNRECINMHSLARTWLLAVLQLETHGGRAKHELPHSKLAHPSPTTDDDKKIVQTKMALRRKHTPPKNQTPLLAQGGISSHNRGREIPS